MRLSATHSIRDSRLQGARRLLAILAGTMLGIVALAGASAALAKDGTLAGHWVGTWSASPQAASLPVSVDGRTIREIVHVSIGGTQVRRAPLQRLRCRTLAYRRDACWPAQHGCIDRFGLRPHADVQRVGVHDNPCRRSCGQRPGPSSGPRSRRPGDKHRRFRHRIRGHRTFAWVADDLHIA